jgi:Undecaprenyl-phosphate galactose phosphotransferase WbaP
VSAPEAGTGASAADGARAAVHAPDTPAPAVPPELERLRPRWWPRLGRVAVLAASDLAALLVACGGAYAVWAGGVLGQPPGQYLGLVPLLPLFLVSYATAGLYPGFGIGAVETLRRLTTRTSVTFLVLAAGSFALKAPQTYSRMTFALAWAASVVLAPLVRYAVLSIAGRAGWWGMAAVLVGAGRQVERTVALLREAVSLGYRPVAVIATDPSWRPRAALGVPLLRDIAAAVAHARRGVRVALLVDEGGAAGAVLAAWLQEHFPHTVVLHAVDGLPVEGVGLRNLGGMLGIEYTNQLLRWHNRALKRAVDLLLGSSLLVLALPLMAAGALLVRLFSRGPALYFQEREGLGGRTILVPKLRTMRPDAEAQLARYLAEHPAERALWERQFKLRRDPRVVPFAGALLRRTSLDELPQLWSVVVGQMSLVGPRPFPEYHLERFPPEFRALRRRVRPGITGLWQVMVRSEGGVDEQQALDTYYIRNWSLWMDAYVLAKTFAAVLTARGAY